MTKQEIIDRKDDIYECAKVFRDKANSLMLQMSQTFGFDLRTLEGLTDQIYKKTYKNKGI